MLKLSKIREQSLLILIVLLHVRNLQHCILLVLLEAAALVYFTMFVITITFRLFK